MRMISLMLSRKLGEKRWTQAQLARVTGIRPNTINELYHQLGGANTRINLHHLDLICEALECDLDDLLERHPEDHHLTIAAQGSGCQVNI